MSNDLGGMGDMASSDFGGAGLDLDRRRALRKHIYTNRNEDLLFAALRFYCTRPYVRCGCQGIELFMTHGVTNTLGGGFRSSRSCTKLLLLHWHVYTQEGSGEHIIYMLVLLLCCLVATLNSEVR